MSMMWAESGIGWGSGKLFGNGGGISGPGDEVQEAVTISCGLNRVSLLFIYLLEQFFIERWADKPAQSSPTQGLFSVMQL